MASKKEVLEIAGREVSISNPDKVYFPRAGLCQRVFAGLGDIFR